MRRYLLEACEGLLPGEAVRLAAATLPRHAASSRFPFFILGLFWDNGKENGNYYSTLGLYWDNGKEHGNYRDYSGDIGVK